MASFPIRRMVKMTALRARLMRKREWEREEQQTRDEEALGEPIAIPSCPGGGGRSSRCATATHEGVSEITVPRPHTHALEKGPEAVRERI